MQKGEILEAVQRIDSLLASAKIVQPVLSRVDHISIATDMKNIYDYIALDENADEKLPEVMPDVTEIKTE